MNGFLLMNGLKREADDPSQARLLRAVVEIGGLEPLTYALRTHRSPN